MLFFSLTFEAWAPKDDVTAASTVGVHLFAGTGTFTDGITAAGTVTGWIESGCLSRLNLQFFPAAIFFRDRNISFHQLVEGDLKQLAEQKQTLDVGKIFSVLPVGNGLPCYQDLFGKFIL